MLADKVKVITYNNEPNSEFTKLGVPLKVVRKAIEVGVSAKRREDGFSATTAGGYNAWNGILSTLRYELKTLKWGEVFRQNGVEGIKSPLRGMSIIVNSGDANTGIASETPRPKNQKGSGYLDMMEQNLNLFEINVLTSPTPIDPNQTWILLYYIDDIKNEVRFELSLPTTLEKQSIGGWKMRHIFEPLDLSNKPKVKRKQENNEISEEVDFDILRKNG